MNRTSTPCKRKPVKQEKPSQRIINNILNYSKSLETFAQVYGKPVFVINN